MAELAKAAIVGHCRRRGDAGTFFRKGEDERQGSSPFQADWARGERATLDEPSGVSRHTSGEAHTGPEGLLV